MDTKDKHLEDLKQTILDTLKHMKTVRQKSEAFRWEACALVRHRTGTFNLGESAIPNTPIYNTSGVDAFRTTRGGLMAHLISQNIRWFRFTTMGKNFLPSDKIYGANDYLELLASLIMALFSNSNFYVQAELAIADSLAQGTSAEMILEDVDDSDKSKVILFDTIDPQEFYIAENSRRRVDTFYREYELPAQVAKEKWGDELPKEVLDHVSKGSGHTLCKFVHAIYPRRNVLSAKGVPIFSTSKRFASVHYSYVGDAVFRESGFDEFPVAVQRWALNGTSPYATSPVIDILPELRKLNEYSKEYAMAVQMGLHPPVFAPENLKGRLHMVPYGEIYGNAQAGKPELLQTSIDINHLAAEIIRIEQKISRLLYADLFNILMRQEKERTATEVREIKGEGLVLLASVVGNMQEEKIIPLVMRTMAILNRVGMLPRPPDELLKASAEGRVRIEMDGPLAQSMKAYHQTTGITQGMQALAAVMQLNPASQVNVDFDELMRQAMSANGMPQSIIREWVMVQKIKQAEQAQMQQQAQLEQAQVQADLIGKMGKADGSVAQQMMQGQR